MAIRTNCIALVAPLALLMAACSSSPGTDDSGRGLFGYTGKQSEDGNGSGSDTTIIDPGGGGGTGNGGGLVRPVGPGEECVAVEQEAESSARPVDIIFIIDNSSSMEGEINEVQDRINEDFARIIEESKVDYRVIMLSRYGDVNISEPVGDSDNPICIHAPLGAGDCNDPENTPVEHNPPRFYHFSADIISWNSLCMVFDAYATSDEIGGGRPDWIPIAPAGYSRFLRTQAFKTFVEITDDGVECTTNATAGGQTLDLFDEHTAADGEQVAQQFDDALLALSPEQFGTAEDRNYNFYSIVAMLENDPPGQAWLPSEPIQTEMCTGGGGAEDPGTGYQALSRLTGALRYPTCLNENFNSIFNAIAQGVVVGALSCEWAIPAPPVGETLDKNRVSVLYTPGGGEEELIAYASTAEDCGDADGWYYDNNDDPQRVVVCPATCDRLHADPEGEINVRFECEDVITVE